MWDVKSCKQILGFNKKNTALMHLLSLPSQWTSEPYESVDGTITAKDGVQSADLGCNQRLDKIQDQDSASASTAPGAADQKTV